MDSLVAASAQDRRAENLFASRGIRQYLHESVGLIFLDRTADAASSDEWREIWLAVGANLFRHADAAERRIDVTSA